jgi:hypothetical protein
VSENRVLRRIFGPKREEVNRKMEANNEDPDSFYSSANVITTT